MTNILLVDDDPMVCDAIRKRLERDGHSVRVAGNGNEALQMVDQSEPELVITDIIMPEREGIETLMEMKQRIPGIKVIAMSGGGRIGRTDHLKLAAHLGADATLIKPFTTAQLRTALADLAMKTA